MAESSGGGPDDPPSKTRATLAVRRLLARIALITVTIASILIVTFGVHFNPDVVALLPKKGDAGALARYLHAFGGGGLSVILIQSPDAEKNGEIAERVTRELGEKSSVAFAADKITIPSFDKAPDPLILFRYADTAAQKRLQEALTPEGMRARLHETHSMLLAPGSSAMKDYFIADPLRLSQVIFEGGAIGAGVKARSDGAFASEDGTSYIVVVKAKGQALRGDDARAFMGDVDAVLSPLKKESPDVYVGITGPHAYAAAIEQLVRDDVWRAGVLSMFLASAVFLAVFRRARALIAITPPLALGTLWTAALAWPWASGLSAIAMAFASVVVGVGFDTGVHVYSAVMDARREGFSPEEAVHVARERTSKPVLMAAVIAGFAFGSLALSSIEAVAQLGILCGAGEILTAVAIVLITPELAGLLERGKPAKPVPSGWTRWVHAITATKGRAAIALLIAAGLACAWVPLHLHLADAMIAIRPKIPPVEVEAKISQAFGVRPLAWVVLAADKDRESAMYRTDKIAEALSNDAAIEKVDGLTPFAPSVGMQEERFAARDAMLAGKAEELEAALKDSGFTTAPFAATLESMRHPAHTTVSPDKVLEGDLAILGARYLASDGNQSLSIINVYLRDTPDARAHMIEVVKRVDPDASVTGYARLEADLRASLIRDLPRIGGAAAVIVLVMLFASLKRPKEVFIAMSVLAIGIGCLLGAIASLRIPLHIYSALMIPVMLGITVDEAMFLLHHARTDEHTGGRDPLLVTLEEEGNPVLATALTTSAGFAALGFAHYSPLADLGLVGALGSAAGLVIALIIVPAGLRLMGRGGSSAKQRPAG